MSIPDLPPHPRPEDPDNFDPMADTWMGALNPWGQAVNAVALAVDADAAAAALAKGNAEAARDVASQAKVDAQAARDASQGARDSSVAARDAAQAARDAAQAAAAVAQTTQLTATSASAVVVGTGDKVFVTQSNKQLALNAPVIAVDTANPLRYVAGTVKSYVDTNLTLAVTDFGGAGSCNSWNITVAGIKGAKGDTGSNALAGTASGAINWNGTVSLPSAATVDIGAAASNDLVLTGSAPISSFGTAPAGVSRKLKFAGVMQLTFNVSTLLLPGLANITTAVNDTGQVTSLGGGAWICDYYKRADGRSVVTDPFVPPFTNMAIVTTSQTWNSRVAGPHRVTLIGGGASGAVYKSGSHSGKATGGGAGGLTRKIFNATAGQALTFIIGTGGASVGRTVDGGTNGNNGNASTMSTSGVSLVANGGIGGVFARTATQNLPATGNTPGGTGGTASGGDQNYTGGDGGICGPTGAITSFIASGGGAVNWLGGTPFNGGTAWITNTTANNVQAASAGAGIGGNGGDASAGTDNAAAAGGGGGTGGPGGYGVSGSTGIAGIAVTFSLPPLNFKGAGGAGSTSSNGQSGGDGGGGGGSASPQGVQPSNAGAGGRLAGGGALAGNGPEGNGGFKGGDGGWGAGGGGCAALGISYVYYSGKGGDGVAIIEYV